VRKRGAAMLHWCVFMSEPVYGTIVNYRIGIRTQRPKWCLIRIIGENVGSNVAQFAGRKVVLKYGKNNFVGKIIDMHGKKGVVRAKFRKGVPGQAIGARVKLSD